MNRLDPEYQRNGVTCLIAAQDVKSGKIIAYQQGQTRKEEDFLNHVKQIVSTNSEAEHIIVCDQLNTHKSESLVKWIAQKISYTGSLGKKGKEGILKTMKSRMEFLEDKSHRIRFQFTPKHCSWMNQIENWFSLLQRRVVNNGQFTSVEDLENNIMRFIKYYNTDLFRPVNWLFNGDKYLQKYKG